ncbi:unnamed protein product [Callosobruchus maculatus]|uniref:Uncharacterized protein n=1 Tax=Callosobruchus maculatus TaxID=64391 RepID=A0A653CNE6_CALMS|nr:unnamed protein product [Callosobruchus maculatus]
MPSTRGGETSSFNAKRRRPKSPRTTNSLDDDRESLTQYTCVHRFFAHLMTTLCKSYLRPNFESQFSLHPPPHEVCF